MGTCLAWIISLYTWEQTAPHQHPNEATEKCLMSRLFKLPLADVTLTSRRIKKKWYWLKKHEQNDNRFLSVPVYLSSVRTHIRNCRRATWTGDLRSDGAKLSCFVEPRPWKSGKIQSGLLRCSRRRTTRGAILTVCFFLLQRLKNTFYVYWGKARGVNNQYKHIHHSTKLRNICVIARCATGDEFRPGCTLFSIIFTAPVGGNDLRPPEQHMDCSQV